MYGMANASMHRIDAKHGPQFDNIGEITAVLNDKMGQAEEAFRDVRDRVVHLEETHAHTDPQWV